MGRTIKTKTKPSSNVVEVLGPSGSRLKGGTSPRRAALSVLAVFSDLVDLAELTRHVRRRTLLVEQTLDDMIGHLDDGDLWTWIEEKAAAKKSAAAPLPPAETPPWVRPFVHAVTDETISCRSWAARTMALGEAALGILRDGWMAWDESPDSPPWASSWTERVKTFRQFLELNVDDWAEDLEQLHDELAGGLEAREGA